MWCPVSTKCLQKVKGRHKTFPVSMRLGGTPVPIPNTMVKTYAADGTALETMWESRWMPDPLSHMRREPHVAKKE